METLSLQKLKDRLPGLFDTGSPEATSLGVSPTAVDIKSVVSALSDDDSDRLKYQFVPANDEGHLFLTGIDLSDFVSSFFINDAGCIIAANQFSNAFFPHVLPLLFVLLHCDALVIQHNGSTVTFAQSRGLWLRREGDQLSAGVSDVVVSLVECILRPEQAEIQQASIPLSSHWDENVRRLLAARTLVEMYQRVVATFPFLEVQTRQGLLYNIPLQLTDAYIVDMIETLRSGGRGTMRLVCHFLDLIPGDYLIGLAPAHPWFKMFMDPKSPFYLTSLLSELPLIDQQLRSFVRFHRAVKREFYRFAISNDLHFEPVERNGIYRVVLDDLPEDVLEIQEYVRQSLISSADGYAAPFFRYRGVENDQDRLEALQEWCEKHRARLIYPFIHYLPGLDMPSPHDEKLLEIWSEILKNSRIICKIDFQSGVFQDAYARGTDQWYQVTQKSQTPLDKIEWEQHAVYAVLFDEMKAMPLPTMSWPYGKHGSGSAADAMRAYRSYETRKMVAQFMAIVAPAVERYDSILRLLHQLLSQTNTTIFSVLPSFEWTASRLNDVTQLLWIFMKALQTGNPYLTTLLQSEKIRLPNFTDLAAWIHFRNVFQFLQFALSYGTTLYPHVRPYDQDTKTSAAKVVVEDPLDDPVMDKLEKTMKNTTLDDDQLVFSKEPTLATPDTWVTKTWRVGLSLTKRDARVSFAKPVPTPVLANTMALTRKILEFLPTPARRLITRLQALRKMVDFSLPVDYHALFEAGLIQSEMESYVNQYAEVIDSLAEDNVQELTAEEVNSAFFFLICRKQWMEARVMGDLLPLVRGVLHPKLQEFAASLVTRKNREFVYADGITEQLSTVNTMRGKIVHLFYWLANSEEELKDCQNRLQHPVVHENRSFTITRSETLRFYLHLEIQPKRIDWVFQTPFQRIQPDILVNQTEAVLDGHDLEDCDVYVEVTDSEGRIWRSGNTYSITVQYRCVRCEKIISSKDTVTDGFRLPCTWLPRFPPQLDYTHQQRVLFEMLCGEAPETEEQRKALETAYYSEAWNDEHSETNPFPAPALEGWGSIRMKYLTPMRTLRYARRPMGWTEADEIVAQSYYRKFQLDQNEPLPYSFPLEVTIPQKVYLGANGVQLMQESNPSVPALTAETEHKTLTGYGNMLIQKHFQKYGTAAWKTLYVKTATLEERVNKYVE